MGRAAKIAMNGPVAVPTLDELASDPERARELPVPVLQTLLIRCGIANASLLGALTVAAAKQSDRSSVEEDMLLDVKAAARRLSTSVDWLYRHSHELPFVVRNGRQVRFSTHGIDRYIRERRSL